MKTTDIKKSEVKPPPASTIRKVIESNSTNKIHSLLANYTPEEESFEIEKRIIMGSVKKCTSVSMLSNYLKEVSELYNNETVKLDRVDLTESFTNKPEY